MVLLNRLLVLSLAVVALAQPILNGMLLSSVESVEARGWWSLSSTVVVVLISVPLAVLLVLKKAENQQARAAAVFAVLLPVVFSWAFMAIFVEGDLPFEHPLRRLVDSRSVGLAAASAVCLTAAFVRFTSGFPVAIQEVTAPHELKGIHAWFIQPRHLWIMLSVSLATATYPLISAPNVAITPDGESLIFTGFFAFAAFLAVTPLFFFSSLLVGTQNLRLGLRHGDATERRRGRWISSGLRIGVLLLVAAYFIQMAIGLAPLPEWLDFPAFLLSTSLFFAAPVIIAVALAVGVLYDGAMGPDLVISTGAWLRRRREKGTHTQNPSP